MELMKEGTFDFDALAAKTSEGLADTVRDELEGHINRGDEIVIVEFTTETLPGTGKNSIVKKRSADLFIKAGSICYRFDWHEYEHVGGKVNESTLLNWMSMYAIDKFLAADQRKGG
ncbi:hypothetical protein MO973_19795 [Paenibacillus sp. TRM 82003]|nr:hypothetical protein [Paenibacillus sp. TRM 82003]